MQLSNQTTHYTELEHYSFFQQSENYLKRKFHHYSGPCGYRNYSYRTYNSPKQVRKSFLSNTHFVNELTHLYKLGYREFEELHCSFYEFACGLITGNSLYYPCFDYRPKNLKRSAYLRQAHHQVKLLSETQEAKKDWREAKGFRRDSAKVEKGYSRKTYAKRQFNRQHRSWVKDLMNNEDYESLPYVEVKKLKDPWLWD